MKKMAKSSWTGRDALVVAFAAVAYLHMQSALDMAANLLVMPKPITHLHRERNFI